MYSVLFLLISLCDVAEYSYNERLDIGLVDAPSDPEKTVFTPFCTPTVGYDLKIKKIFTVCFSF